MTAVLLQPPHPYLDCNLVTLFVFKGLILALVFKMLCFLPFKITARRELSHVRPHPPHLATSEQPMVRGNRDDVSPQSSHPRVSRNGSEHFRWALWSIFFFFLFPHSWAILNPRGKAHHKADVASNQCSLSLRDNCCLVVVAQHITIGTVVWNWD